MPQIICKCHEIEVYGVYNGNSLCDIHLFETESIDSMPDVINSPHSQHCEYIQRNSYPFGTYHR